MRTISARNVNEALRLGVFWINEQAKPITPRDATTLEYPEPVCTIYHNPRERVLFDPDRDANPFFHLMEALWILAGREDVGWLAQFNKQIATYSDDGQRFHAAYGHRLRDSFGIDQIQEVIDLLSREPDTRRAVLQIWNAPWDLNRDSKDIPCNDLVFLKIRDNALQMTVSCRSNDIIWGAYGANAVQFSMIQEYIAGRLGVGVGTLRQISDSYHVYTEGPGAKVWERCQHLPLEYYDPYKYGDVIVQDLIEAPDDWDRDLKQFFEDPLGLVSWHNRFFAKVAVPMLRVWKAYKATDAERVARVIHEDFNTYIDWHVAAKQWLERRYGHKLD